MALLNKLDKDGNSPLMLAAANGDLKKVQELLSLGADPHFTDDGRMTALTRARNLGHDDIVECLKEVMHAHIKIEGQQKKNYTCKSCGGQHIFRSLVNAKCHKCKGTSFTENNIDIVPPKAITTKTPIIKTIIVLSVLSFGIILFTNSEGSNKKEVTSYKLDSPECKSIKRKIEVAKTKYKLHQRTWDPDSVADSIKEYAILLEMNELAEKKTTLPLCND